MNSLHLLGVWASLCVCTHGLLESSRQEKVKLELLYETQCPYSLQYITEQLKDVFEDPVLSDHIDLSLVPYGNAMTIKTEGISKGYRFWHKKVVEDKVEHIFMCQHGEMECLGNMIQACHIELSGNDPKKYMPFIFCMSSKTQMSIESSSFSCAKELNVNIDEIKSCVRESKGPALLSKHGETTKKKRANHVPFVLLEDAHSDNAEQNLLQTLCSTMYKYMPPACLKVGGQREEMVSTKKKNEEMIARSKFPMSQQGTHHGLQPQSKAPPQAHRIGGLPGGHISGIRNVKCLKMDEKLAM
jgi:interferon gamma-inducible protein 30